MLAAIPGLVVVCPSNPSDAYGLMATALASPQPVVFMEPKLLSEDFLEFLGRGGRQTVSFDIPVAGSRGELAPHPVAVPFGKADVRRSGSDVTICSLAVGVHRSLEAASVLESEGISCEVLDLRTLRPLDTGAVVESVRTTGRLLVVDEDYREYGLSGELAAVVLEAGLAPDYARVCVESTLPFNRVEEEAALPNARRIADAVRQLISG
jgi:pyruvate dehydrogenase E1 component beta subunit